MFSDIFDWGCKPYPRIFSLKDDAWPALCWKDTRKYPIESHYHPQVSDRPSQERPERNPLARVSGAIGLRYRAKQLRHVRSSPHLSVRETIQGRDDKMIIGKWSSVTGEIGVNVYIFVTVNIYGFTQAICCA